MTTNSNGQYFTNGIFIAFRDEYDAFWRVSRIETNDGTNLTMTYIGTYTSKTQAMQNMTVDRDNAD